MRFYEALQNHDLRISANNGRWLCGDGDGTWVVYERKPYAKKTTIIISTRDEEAALKVLLDASGE